MWAIFLETGLLLLILGWVAWAAWGPAPGSRHKPTEKTDDQDSNQKP